MTRVVCQTAITAPLGDVFSALCHVERTVDLDPEVLAVNFITENTRGPGVRFEQTRRGPGGKEMVFELEIAEYQENEKARMVCDMSGTVWDTSYVFEPMGDVVQVTVTMDAKAHAFLPKLMNPLMKGMFRKGIAKHLEAVRSRLEG